MWTHAGRHGRRGHTETPRGVARRQVWMQVFVSSLLRWEVWIYGHLVYMFQYPTHLFVSVLFILFLGQLAFLSSRGSGGCSFACEMFSRRPRGAPPDTGASVTQVDSTSGAEKRKKNNGVS